MYSTSRDCGAMSARCIGSRSEIDGYVVTTFVCFCGGGVLFVENI
jgi:hypothetical protein